MKSLKLVLFGICAILGSSFSQADVPQINGAGATFPYPIYSKWFSEFQKLTPDVQINYQSIGSGGGIRQFLEKTVDFGATDSPMTDEQLAKSPLAILHVPMVLGGVVLTYNLPGNPELKLSGEAIADIFLGKITQWNDPKLTALNPTLTLPPQAILVAHRSDGSGTSAIFTDYLSKKSADWKAKVGSGTSVNWPAGLGGKGNEGVTGLIKQTPGSIGYVELIYAKNNQLPMALIKNMAGNFVPASSESVTAAASNVKVPSDFRVSLTDAPGKPSYPISSFTYILIFKKMPDALKGKKILQFLNWAITNGQSFAEPLAYAPLPKSLVPKILAQLKSIKTE